MFLQLIMYLFCTGAENYNENRIEIQYQILDIPVFYWIVL